MPKRPSRPRPLLRWARRAGFFSLGLLGGGALIGCCSFSAPGYSGPASDHFDGDVFVNQDTAAHAGTTDFLRWQLSRDQGPWEMRLDEPPGPAPPERVGRGELRVTFIGHASTLVQMDGINVLTDPVYSERVTPVGGLGPARHRVPGVRFEDLPPIDAVVISHNHYDHLDLPTLERLYHAHHPRFLVGLGNEQLLREAGIEGGMDFDWWQSTEVDDVRIHAVPARHFSGRGLCDRDKTLWAGWVLRGPAGVAYFAGDTGMGKHFQQIRERFGAPRLAVLPIGAYLPRWFMKQVHIDPAQAVEAHRILGAQTSVGVHFGTFALADEGMDQAPVDLAAALVDQAVAPDRFLVLGFGEGRDIDAR
jgi:L-ascorbate metabolism protein UlaG (beta-lactamase superfamily)